MADLVKFTKQGLKAYPYQNKGYVEEEIYPDLIWTKLRLTCEIEEGVTLLDFFNAVDKFENLKIFISQYSWCYDLEQFHQQARIPLTNKVWQDDEIIEKLVVYRDEEGYTGFDGQGTIKGESSNFSLSMTPMNEIAHLPLVLEPAKEDQVFSLLDVLDAIYDDISFYGNPEEVKATAKYLQEELQKIKAGRYDHLKKYNSVEDMLKDIEAP